MSRSRRPAPKKSSRPPANPKSGPPDQSGRVITQVLHEERRISGPLPTPDILLGYDEVLPGAAERIMRMAEKEQANTHEVEGIAVRAAPQTTGAGRYSASWPRLPHLVPQAISVTWGTEPLPQPSAA